MKISSRLLRNGGVFTMPGGFKVNVEILDAEDATEEMGREVLAQYYHEDHTIQLRKSRSLALRRLDFEHELMHMSIDWVDYFTRKSRV
jgi:predicted HTH domain antitoxin